MISLRAARPADAVAIGAVHVAAWRSAYPGILPDDYLARLSVTRQAAHYDAAIRGPGGVFVAVASGVDLPTASPPRIIGFSTVGRGRGAAIADLDLDVIEEVRRTWQFFRDRRPETYGDMVEQLP